MKSKISKCIHGKISNKCFICHEIKKKLKFQHYYLSNKFKTLSI